MEGKPTLDVNSNKLEIMDFIKTHKVIKLTENKKRKSLKVLREELEAGGYFVGVKGKTKRTIKRGQKLNEKSVEQDKEAQQSYQKVLQANPQGFNVSNKIVISGFKNKPLPTPPTINEQILGRTGKAYEDFVKMDVSNLPDIKTAPTIRNISKTIEVDVSTLTKQEILEYQQLATLPENHMGYDFSGDFSIEQAMGYPSLPSSGKIEKLNPETYVVYYVGAYNSIMTGSFYGGNIDPRVEGSLGPELEREVPKELLKKLSKKYGINKIPTIEDLDLYFSTRYPYYDKETLPEFKQLLWVAFILQRDPAQPRYWNKIMRRIYNQDFIILRDIKSIGKEPKIGSRLQYINLLDTKHPLGGNDLIMSRTPLIQLKNMYAFYKMREYTFSKYSEGKTPVYHIDDDEGNEYEERGDFQYNTEDFEMSGLEGFRQYRTDYVKTLDIPRTFGELKGKNAPPEPPPPPPSEEDIREAKDDEINQTTNHRKEVIEIMRQFRQGDYEGGGAAATARLKELLQPKLHAINRKYGHSLLNIYEIRYDGKYW